MYPQLINQASRLAPVLSRILSRGGSFASPFWKTSQVEAPEVNATPMAPAGKPVGPQVPISQSNYGTPTNYSAGTSPQDRLAHAFGMFPGVPVPRPRPEQVAAAAPSVPTPQPRPAEAPQPEPEMSFWQRNAAMMRDPATGEFIDPSGAAKAVRGPDLISKMMSYLHAKDIG